MKRFRLFSLFCALGAGLLWTTCAEHAPSAPTSSEAKPATAAEVDAFVKEIEVNLLRLNANKERAGFLAETHSTHDTVELEEQASNDLLTYAAQVAPKARVYLADNTLTLSSETKRKLHLLILSQLTPPPASQKEREELAALTSQMKSYNANTKVCVKGDKGETCYTQSKLKAIVADPARIKDKKESEIKEAWLRWYDAAKPLRAPYEKFVSLSNQGAKNLGFHDTGELWRANYDMNPADFEKDVNRLWTDVKPLYTKLHCYVRTKLRAHYGTDKVPEKGPIPAHLLGNMWAQEWESLYPILAPAGTKEETGLNKILQEKADAYVAKQGETLKVLPQKGEDPAWAYANHLQKANEARAMYMLRLGETFFVSLGFDKLPNTFYERSMLVEPRDRVAQCHASAVDVSWQGDVRLKMCIVPNAENFNTIHHELGHDYYFLMYKDLSALFQNSAHDGFHEGLGDTLQLSATPPEYLVKSGLTEQVPQQPADDTGMLLKSALSKVAFLPFGKSIDEYRWNVFSGKISPAQYNKAWWDLALKNQGIAPPVARTEENFDIASKYHVPGNVPYVRYFLARILQFQMHRALCKTAGHKGPLHTCSVYGNKEAGAQLKAFMKLGASKPWQEALQTMSGETQTDASAMLEYYQPLIKYLDEQNKGQTCGW